MVYTLKKRHFESKWKYDVKTKVSDSKKLLSPWVREDKTVNGINCRWLAAASVVQFDNFLATSHFRQHALFNTGKKMNSHSEKYMSSRCIFWRLKVSMTRIQYVYNTARVIGYTRCVEKVNSSVFIKLQLFHFLWCLKFLLFHSRVFPLQAKNSTKR